MSNIDIGFDEELEQFEQMLTKRTDQAVRSFWQACQHELDARTQRELEIAKSALSKCSKDQLLSVLLHLGIELPAPDKKPRERKNPALYGFKEYVTEQGDKFYVPKFFNPATQEHCVGSQAVFLHGLGTNEKLAQFGTVQQLQAGTINLAELVELGLVYTMQDGACVPVTLDMLPAEQPELPPEASAAAEVQPKAGRRTRRQETAEMATE